MHSELLIAIAASIASWRCLGLASPRPGVLLASGIGTAGRHAPGSRRPGLAGRQREHASPERIGAPSPNFAHGSDFDEEAVRCETLLPRLPTYRRT